MKRAIIICGPTASGKTFFAHEFAKRNKGEIICCDSMQIYSELPIITASPSEKLKSELLYHLYNFLPLNEEFSLAKYVEFALKAMVNITSKGNLPVIVGGTGLYINSLLYGYNDIPNIDPKLREEIRNLQQEIGQIEFFKLLESIDPIAGAKLNQNDKQRSLRAYEVMRETGKSIFTIQKNDNENKIDNFNFEVIFLYPERKYLYQNCDERLKSIFSEGGIEEISNLKDNYSNDFLYNLKAIAISQILDYLNGNINLEKAIELAQNKTRQYAKRQITWFKHQIKEKITLEYSNQEDLIRYIL